MEIDTLPAPVKPETKARWMNDTDLNHPLVVEEMNELSGGEIEIVFSTPLLERVKRTTRTDRSEYAFIYNMLRDGCKVVKYIKQQGFRVPTRA